MALSALSGDEVGIVFTQLCDTHLLSHDGGTTFSVPWAAGSGYTAAADYPQPTEPLRILHVDADLVVVSNPARAIHPLCTCHARAPT